MTGERGLPLLPACVKLPLPVLDHLDQDLSVSTQQLLGLELVHLLHDGVPLAPGESQHLRQGGATDLMLASQELGVSLEGGKTVKRHPEKKLSFYMYVPYVQSVHVVYYSIGALIILCSPHYWGRRLACTAEPGSSWSGPAH